MATNYYAQRIPTIERKRELVDLILVEKNYNRIVSEVMKTFGLYGVDVSGEPKANGGIIHLGRMDKPNGRFLWNPNVHIFNELKSRYEGAIEVQYTEIVSHMLYSLNKIGIETFIRRPDLNVYTEYGEWVDKDDFLKMAFEFDDWDEEETKLYHELQYPDEELKKELKRLGYNVKKDSSIFYNDGLMFLATQDFA